MNGKIHGTVNFTSPNPKSEPFSEYEKDFINLVARWVGALMEQRENRIKILEEQNLLKTFVSSAPAAIAMLDKHMNYISASKKWYTDQNLKGDIIGKSHYRVFPEIPPNWKAMHSKALKGEIIKPGIERFERADGSVQWLQGEIHPWYKAEDKVGGIIIFINDLTDLKRQEVELRKAKEEAEKAGKIKEQFLSTMSHEIRTPLNAIIGTTNLLEMEHPELAGSNRLKLLKFGSNNLLALINDILDIQKIESGNVEIVNEEHNLQELTDSIVETWRSIQNVEKVDLSLKYDNALSSYYFFDKTRLTQVLNNLISNALKFTEKGNVNLSVDPVGEGLLQFSVSDTGIGIPEDKIETIFESFKQISNKETLRAGGTGLGLAISKSLVEMMGGSLQVQSTLGMGTRFYFDIPLGASDKKDTRSERSELKPDRLKMEGLRILVVEDNHANQEIAKGFLKRWGVQVDIAVNGLEAVDKVKTKLFDLVLMDVRMPEMDGYEAAREIRAMKGSYFKQLPIIALTAGTLTESMSEVKESGMNEMVSKPFDPDDLFDKINSLASKKLVSENVNNRNNNITQFKFLNETLGDNKETVQKIVNMSIDSIEADVSGSAEAQKLKDVEKAFNHLHKMKSNLANLDFNELSDKVPNHKSEDFWIKLPDFLDEVGLKLHDLKEDLSHSEHNS